MAASSLAGLFTSAFLLITGNGLLSTLIPLRGKLDGFTSVEIGLVGSSYFFGMLLGTFGAPLIIRQFGYVRAFAALLSGRSKDSNRGRVYAVYQIMTYAGSAVGQQVLGVAPGHPGLLFVGAAACYALSLVPLIASRAEPPRRPREVRVRLVWFATASPIGAAVALCVGAANGSFYALAPVYGLGLGLGAGQIATFMTAVTIGTAFAIYPVAFLSDAHDRRVVILTFAALGAAAEFLLARIGAGADWILWVTAMAVGATSFVLYTVGYAHANDRIEADRTVIVSAAMLFLYCVGAVAAPIVASLLMGSVGVRALFIQNGAIHAALALFVVWRIFRRPAAARSGSAQPSPSGAPRDAI
jgi:MFS family permease